MKGMSAAYFVYQLIPGLIDATAYFAQAQHRQHVTDLSLSRVEQPSGSR
jgi:hypothetical protein